MSSLHELSAQKPQKNGTPVPEEKLESMLVRLLKPGRPAKNVPFVVPGLPAMTFRHEVLNNGENWDAKIAARNHVVTALGDGLRNTRPEDTDIYDERLIVEVLSRALKNPDEKWEGNGVTRYEPAAPKGPEDFKQLTSEHIALLYNQYQLVKAEFMASQAQLLIMQDLEGFCQQAAKAVAEGKESDFLVSTMASFSYSDAISSVVILAASLSDYLAPYPTQSSSDDSSESSLGISDGTTDSSTGSPLDTSKLLDNSQALQQSLANLNSNSSVAEVEPALTHETDGQKAAEELAAKL